MIYLHVCPRSGNRGILYPAIFFEKQGVPPFQIFVHEAKKNTNQFVNVLRNIQFGLECCRELYDCGQTVDPQIMIVTNNQTVVTWFQKKQCPAVYADEFTKILAKLENLPIKSLTITSDINCLAKKYAVKDNITSTEFDDDSSEEEQYVSFATILERT